jgi:molybdopterin converting factor small subunit
VAEVVLSQSILALFPGIPRRVAVEASSVREMIAALDRAIPGIADRLVRTGPAIREHINVFVDGDVADLDTPVGPDSTIHVIPAVSGGA